MYSQYGEDSTIFEFFKGKKGNLLDLGANDGVTISNSLLFIENGWNSVLVEASPYAFEKLVGNHGDKSNVYCINKCLSTHNGKITFYHNTSHFGKGDVDLLSTVVIDNFRDSSRTNPFSSFEIDCFDFDTVYKNLPYEIFQYISIDIEGMDYDILSQMDLKKMQTELIIIEYNNVPDVRKKIIDYCSSFGLHKILLDNKINLILTI